MANNQSQVICKSIFKNGESKPAAAQFTRIWIELINQSEKNKRIRPFKY